jgi:hypothetical protein
MNWVWLLRGIRSIASSGVNLIFRTPEQHADFIDLSRRRDQTRFSYVLDLSFKVPYGGAHGRDDIPVQVLRSDGQGVNAASRSRLIRNKYKIS